MRIVVIGYTGPGDQAYLCAVHFLFESGYPEAAEDVDPDRGLPDVGFYDVSTHPEWGDGVDAIEPSTELVIALHISGMKGQDPNPSHDEMYNRRNGEIRSLCARLRIPLLVVGEQPDPSVTDLVALYVGNEILTI